MISHDNINIANNKPFIPFAFIAHGLLTQTIIYINTFVCINISIYINIYI